ncbi:hypothetical protein AHAS_Ahas12G0243400 [Arachis hypogaea]
MIAKEYVETHQRILQSEGLKTKNQSFEDYIEGNENTAFNKRIYYLPLTKFSSFSEMEDQGEVETTITSKYTWIIKNFSKLKCDKLYSETFFTGKHPWRIRIHPEGNKVNCLSIYLSVGDNANFPAGWSKTANIKMSLINQLYSDDTITHGTSELLFRFLHSPYSEVYICKAFNGVSSLSFVLLMKTFIF